MLRFILGQSNIEAGSVGPSSHQPNLSSAQIRKPEESVFDDLGMRTTNPLLNITTSKKQRKHSKNGHCFLLSVPFYFCFSPSLLPFHCQTNVVDLQACPHFLSSLAMWKTVSMQGNYILINLRRREIYVEPDIFQSDHIQNTLTFSPGNGSEIC